MPAVLPTAPTEVLPRPPGAISETARFYDGAMAGPQLLPAEATDVEVDESARGPHWRARRGRRTDGIFTSPQESRTDDYITGRVGLAPEHPPVGMGTVEGSHGRLHHLVQRGSHG